MNFKRVYFYLSSFTLVFFTILLVLFLNYFLVFEMKIIENSLFLILFLTLFGSLFFLLISSKILKPIFQSEENIKVIPATDAPKQYFSFATNKKSTQLMNDIDKAIAQMKETGEFARIYKKWFAQEPPQMPITPEEAVQLSK